MTLYFIGLGLADEKDITCNGLEIVRKCTYLYLDTYTSMLSKPIQALETLYAKKIIKADRSLVEKHAEQILEKAKSENVAFLVVGDPFGATTHIDLRLRAHKEGIAVKVIHNASIVNAVAEIGLELYKYGKVTSIPFDNNKIATPFEVFKMNQKNGLHTLFLLDLDSSKNKFMTIRDAIDYLFRNNLDSKQLCIGIAALGSDQQEIKVMTAAALFKEKFSKKPQCLIIPGKLHFMEEEALKLWK
jgi:diphthine synthase